MKVELVVNIRVFSKFMNDHESKLNQINLGIFRRKIIKKILETRGKAESSDQIILKTKYGIERSVACNAASL